jgi:mono/diheme cytochrome c family protein
MKQPQRLAAACALALAACAGGEPTRDERLAEGHALYLAYCVACHGADGNGGPVAAYLSPAPRDLRGIAARNGGSFPRSLVEGWIDGREAVGAHGTREMPVWGRELREEGSGENAEARIHAKLALLVEYLESVQREGTP